MERNHLEGLGVCEKMMLKWLFKKQDGRAWLEFFLFRIGISGGFLWMQGISWLTQEVWASQEGFYYIELVNNLSVIGSVIFSGDEVLHMFVWTTDQRKFLCLDMKRMKNQMFLHIFRWVLYVCYVEGLCEMNLFDHFFFTVLSVIFTHLSTVELHLSGSQIIWIGLALCISLSRILQNLLALKLPLFR